MLALFRLCVAAGALAAATAVSLPAFARDAAASAPPATSVTISGAVEHALTVRVADLRAFPPAQIVELRLAGRGADPGKASVLLGVRLRDLVDRAKIVKRDHNTVKKLAIIATATDGYKAVFSWNELFNADLGDSVLVIFERDGKALGAEEGPLALISGKDLRTGPRHVKWLQAVEVRQIAD
jgi:DMSO/TMAO reductase YedYZ molybdopterin-dependent catalytic subunit